MLVGPVFVEVCERRPHSETIRALGWRVHFRAISRNGRRPTTSERSRALPHAPHEERLQRSAWCGANELARGRPNIRLESAKAGPMLTSPKAELDKTLRLGPSKVGRLLISFGPGSTHPGPISTQIGLRSAAPGPFALALAWAARSLPRSQLSGLMIMLNKLRLGSAALGAVLGRLRLKLGRRVVRIWADDGSDDRCFRRVKQSHARVRLLAYTESSAGALK